MARRAVVTIELPDSVTPSKVRDNIDRFTAESAVEDMILEGRVQKIEVNTQSLYELI